MTHVSDIRMGNHPILARFADLRATVAARLAQHRKYRVTLSELRNLTARDLRDLGIHPSQIDTIARESAYI